MKPIGDVGIPVGEEGAEGGREAGKHVGPPPPAIGDEGWGESAPGCTGPGGITTATPEPPRDEVGLTTLAAAAAAAASLAVAFKLANLLLRLDFTSPAGQRWQWRHSSPFVQPCGLQNQAQGRHSPLPWVTEPMDIEGCLISRGSTPGASTTGFLPVLVLAAGDASEVVAVGEPRRVDEVGEGRPPAPLGLLLLLLLLLLMMLVLMLLTLFMNWFTLVGESGKAPEASADEGVMYITGEACRGLSRAPKAALLTWLIPKMVLLVVSMHMFSSEGSSLLSLELSMGSMSSSSPKCMAKLAEANGEVAVTMLANGVCQARLALGCTYITEEGSSMSVSGNEGRALIAPRPFARRAGSVLSWRMSDDLSSSSSSSTSKNVFLTFKLPFFVTACSSPETVPGMVVSPSA
mmetsp:Transcript_14657/g.32344  ORF Transcript_14657/g.32344 Transcript_14657/m.32344 type:complete len:405 (+) Transcript_14657:481-1695(+)